MGKKENNTDWDEFTDGLDESLKSIRKRVPKGILIGLILVSLCGATVLGAFIYSRINPQGIEYYDPNFDNNIDGLTLSDICYIPNYICEGLYENVKIESDLDLNINVDNAEFGHNSDSIFNLTIQYNPDLCNPDITIGLSLSIAISYQSTGYYSTVAQGLHSGTTVLNQFNIDTIGKGVAYVDIYAESFNKPFENTTLQNPFNLDYMLGMNNDSNWLIKYFGQSGGNAYLSNTDRVYFGITIDEFTNMDVRLNFGDFGFFRFYNYASLENIPTSSTHPDSWRHYNLDLEPGQYLIIYDRNDQLYSPELQFTLS